MRITRSGLRRIIAEESARILAETKKRDPRHFSKGSGEPHRDGDGDDVQSAIDALMDTGEDPFPFGEPAEDDEDDYSYGDDPDEFADLPAGEIQRRWRDIYETKAPKRDEDKTDDDWAEEQLQGVMDYYGHPDPYGDDEALEKGYEYDGAGGWKKPSLDEGEDDDLGGAASASDSGDRDGRRGEHLGDDPDWGPPGHDDWHIDNYDEEGDDIEGSDFDEMIDPADDNDDPMKSSWMNPDPYADTAPDDWAMADEPDWGRRSETGRTREKYRTTGDSDPGDAYTHMGPRGIDEARWAKLAGILKG